MADQRCPSAPQWWRPISPPWWWLSSFFGPLSFLARKRRSPASPRFHSRRYSRHHPDLDHLVSPGRKAVSARWGSPSKPEALVTPSRSPRPPVTSSLRTSLSHLCRPSHGARSRLPPLMGWRLRARAGAEPGHVEPVVINIGVGSPFQIARSFALPISSFWSTVTVGPGNWVRMGRKRPGNVEPRPNQLRPATRWFTPLTQSSGVLVVAMPDSAKIGLVVNQPLPAERMTGPGYSIANEPARWPLATLAPAKTGPWRTTAVGWVLDRVHRTSVSEDTLGGNQGHAGQESAGPPLSGNGDRSPCKTRIGHPGTRPEFDLPLLQAARGGAFQGKQEEDREIIPGPDHPG